MFSSLYPLARSHLFRMDAEDAHHLTLRMLGAAGRTGLAGMLAARGPDSPRTVMGITLFWLLLYGGIVGLSLLPDAYPTPDKLLGRLKFVLRGQYDSEMFSQVMIACGVLSAIAAVIGMVGFSRKDV